MTDPDPWPVPRAIGVRPSVRVSRPQPTAESVAAVVFSREDRPTSSFAWIDWTDVPVLLRRSQMRTVPGHSSESCRVCRLRHPQLVHLALFERTNALPEIHGSPSMRSTYCGWSMLSLSANASRSWSSSPTATFLAQHRRSTVADATKREVAHLQHAADLEQHVHATCKRRYLQHPE